MPTWEWILAVCAGFICIVNAIEKLQSIIKKAKEPQTTNEEKLARDYVRLNEHDKELKAIRKDMDYIMDSLLLLMENDMVSLEHMRTDNATGKIAAREKAIHDFLLKHQKLKQEEA